MPVSRSFASALILVPAVLFYSSSGFAKQVDCLVTDKTATYIDGACEFKTTDRNGSFTLTLDTIELKLMADPGAKTGRAYYDDTASSEASWVTDVERDGACWKHNDVQICAWAGSRPASGKAKTASGSPQAAIDTVKAFYKSYFAAYVRGAETPEIDISRTFKADIQKSKKACKGYDGPCGWGADSLPYLNSQDPDVDLSYEKSGISFKENQPGLIQVDLNVNPSSPDVVLNTIIFKMLKENGQWVADDILYKDGEATLSTREMLAAERGSILNEKASR